MKEFTKQFIELMAIDSPTGYTGAAADFTLDALKKMGFKPYFTRKGCVVCDIGGEGQPLVMSAHIDTLGGMVHEIKPSGRLRVTRIGGLQAANVEAENVKVVTRDGKKYDGCMQMENASSHVNLKLSELVRDFDCMEVVLDENVSSREDVVKLGISEGDFVLFDPRTHITESGYIKSRFLDDKLSVAMLLEIARRVSSGRLTLKRRVYIYISVYEEVGHGCSAAMPDADDILSIDMGCVGTGLRCTERMVSICAKDSGGPYNYEMTGELINVAKELKLDYAVDIYPGYGSDAEAALRAGYDMRHALIGAGVYASHGYERSHLDGVKNTLRLIEGYIGK